MDGTLVNSMGAFADVAAQVINKYYGMDLHLARSEYLRTSGLPFFYQLQEIFSGHVQNEVASLEFEAAKKHNYHLAPFFDDVVPFLQFLKSQQIKVVVSSNNDTKNVQEKLAVHLDLFDDILGFEPGHMKGEPHLKFLESKYGVSRSEILFIGDSLHDALLAISCHVDFVGRCGTFTEHDFFTVHPKTKTVVSFKELEGWLCN